MLLCTCHAVALAHPSANQENPQLGHQRRRESGGKLAADCTWSTWGAGPRPQNSRQKENPGRHVPPYGPGHSCEDIGQLSRNPMQPISRRRGHPRCSGNPDARGCVVGDGGAPFMGVFHKKIGVVDGQGRGLILVAPLTQHGTWLPNRVSSYEHGEHKR